MPAKKPKTKTKPSAKPAAKPLISPQALSARPEVHHHYYPIKPKRFDFGKLSFGLFLVVMGILYLAKNFGWLNIDFNFDLWQLWPLLIIFIGLSMITGRTVASIFAGVILTLTVLTITFILVLGQNDFRINIKTSANSPTGRNDVSIKGIKQIFPIDISQDQQATDSEVVIKSSFSNANISGGGEQLAKGRLETNFAELIANSQTLNGKQTVNLEVRPKLAQMADRSSLLDLKLNNEQVSSVYLNSIASTINFSLAKLSSRLITINATASSINLDLNDSQSQLINLRGQASEINLTLPTTAGVKLSLKKPQIIDSVKLKKIDSLTYESLNYQEAKEKIEVSLDLSVSNLIIK